jgi:hypothetical protein
VPFGIHRVVGYFWFYFLAFLLCAATDALRQLELLDRDHQLRLPFGSPLAGYPRTTIDRMKAGSEAHCNPLSVSQLSGGDSTLPNTALSVFAAFSEAREARAFTEGPSPAPNGLGPWQPLSTNHIPTCEGTLPYSRFHLAPFLPEIVSRVAAVMSVSSSGCPDRPQTKYPHSLSPKKRELLYQFRPRLGE